MLYYACQSRRKKKEEEQHYGNWKIVVMCFTMLFLSLILGDLSTKDYNSYYLYQIIKFAIMLCIMIFGWRLIYPWKCKFFWPFDVNDCFLVLVTLVSSVVELKVCYGAFTKGKHMLGTALIFAVIQKSVQFGFHIIYCLINKGKRIDCCQAFVNLFDKIGLAQAASRLVVFNEMYMRRL